MLEEKPQSSLLYRATAVLLFIILKIIYRLSTSGQENIPRTEAAILVANHTSFLDPPIIAVAFKRQVSFMAKKELFRIPVLGRLLILFSSFPVSREKADLRAFKTALKLLRKKGIVGLFPEGTRQRLGYKKLGPMHTGAAYLALKSGVPLIPVGISGTDKVIPTGKHLPRFPRIFIAAGKPIRLDNQKPSRENLAEITKKIEKAIVELII